MVSPLSCHIDVHRWRLWDKIWLSITALIKMLPERAFTSTRILCWPRRTFPSRVTHLSLCPHAYIFLYNKELYTNAATFYGDHINACTSNWDIYRLVLTSSLAISWTSNNVFRIWMPSFSTPVVPSKVPNSLRFPSATDSSNAKPNCTMLGTTCSLP